MTDVFISYSRKDKEFVQVLHQALAKSKYEAWVDWDNIPLTADWWDEIKSGIEAADTFVFVISPDSVSSKVCGREIDHAMANNKRLVPIVRRDGFDTNLMHSELRRHNWLFFKEDNDLDVALQSLVKALNTDLNYVRAHTRVLVKALEWEKKHRRDDLLLRGDDLKEAEQWLADALQVNHEPLPTEQHKTYISKSREVEVANQRLVAAGEKAKRRVRIGAGILAGTVVAAIAIISFAQHSLQRSNKFARLEQDAISALQQFEYQEIEALLQAMNAAEDLKQLMGSGDKPLRYYTPHNAPRVLQQILDRISQKNKFSNHAEAFLDHAISVTFSPDGKALGITGVDGKATLKTPQGIDLTDLNGHFEDVWQAEFSPDGQMLATTSDDIFRLLSRNGALIKTLEHPSGRTGRIEFSPDGKYMAISGWDKDLISLLDNVGNPITDINAQKAW